MEHAVLADNARGCMVAGLCDLRLGEDRVLAVLPSSSPFAQSFCVVCAQVVPRSVADGYCTGDTTAAMAAAYAGNEREMRKRLGQPELSARDAALADVCFRTNQSCVGKIYVRDTSTVSETELLRAVRDGGLHADALFHGGQSLLALASGKLASLPLAAELLAQPSAARCINGRDQQGMSALAQAVCKGHPKIAGALLKAGASPSQPDFEEGLTPYGHSLRAMGIEGIFSDEAELQRH